MNALLMAAEQEPVIDWSKDEDVVGLAKITDEQAINKGWPDDKIAGMFIRKILHFNEPLNTKTCLDPKHLMLTAVKALHTHTLMQLSFASRQHGMFRRTTCTSMSAKMEGHTAKLPRNVVDLPTSSKERRRSVTRSIRAFQRHRSRKPLMKYRRDMIPLTIVCLLRCDVQFQIGHSSPLKMNSISSSWSTFELVSCF